MHQLWCTAQHAQHAQQTQSWVMGAEAPTSSSWAPTAFGRSRYGGAVGPWGDLGEPGGPGTDAQGLTVAFLSGKYTEKSYRQVPTSFDIDRSELFGRSDLDRSCEATRVFNNCSNELTLPCSPLFRFCRGRSLSTSFWNLAVVSRQKKHWSLVVQ